MIHEEALYQVYFYLTFVLIIHLTISSISRLRCGNWTAGEDDSLMPRILSCHDKHNTTKLHIALTTGNHSQCSCDSELLL